MIATFVMAVASWAAEPRLFVTAKDLIASNHRIEVAAGAVFLRPGRYEGRLTMVGTLGTGASDVMPLVVIVKEPIR